jgi:site-specific DNA recombinase
MMVNILGVVAQWEREAIAERTKAALSVKRAKREKTGGSVPYGYRVVAGVEEGETPQLEEHPREMKVLEKILWWREEKNLSYAKIANRLNERSVPTKLGRPWTKGTVKNVIDRVHRERLEGDMREANNVRSRFPGRKGHRKGL